MMDRRYDPDGYASVTIRYHEHLAGKQLGVTSKIAECKAALISDLDQHPARTAGYM